MERIRRILGNRRVVRVDELCSELGVSAATVRRDLVELDQRGHLHRVHGGAVCVERRLEEPLFEDKAALAAAEKQRIADAALAFIKPNDSVFLDGGSTVLALARLLTDMGQLTVVTNSLRVALTLSAAGPRLILVGGEFRTLSQTFVGSLTQPLLSQLRMDTAFMGTIGLSGEEGLTTTDPREAQTKEIVMAHSRRVVLLADSSKIGKVSFVRFGSLADVDVLITDGGAGRRDVSMFRKRSVRVITAENGERS
jgi:DeoR/GlpR family transcriptional regulator of sugar metabolism